MALKRKVFISYKFEDTKTKDLILKKIDKHIIDKHLSEHEAYESYDESQIMQKLQENHIKDSAVTILILSKNSAKNYDAEPEKSTRLKWLWYEVKASLSARGNNNTRNGLILVVDDQTNQKLDPPFYVGKSYCISCEDNTTKIRSETLLTNVKDNIFVEEKMDCEGRHINKKDQYVIDIKLSDFIVNPTKYIEEAFGKAKDLDYTKHVKVGN